MTQRSRKSRTELLEESSIEPVAPYTKFEDVPKILSLILTCFIN